MTYLNYIYPLKINVLSINFSITLLSEPTFQKFLSSCFLSLSLLIPIISYNFQALHLHVDYYLCP